METVESIFTRRMASGNTKREDDRYSKTEIRNRSNCFNKKTDNNRKYRGRSSSRDIKGRRAGREGSRTNRSGSKTYRSGSNYESQKRPNRSGSGYKFESRDSNSNHRRSNSVRSNSRSRGHRNEKCETGKDRD